MLVDRFNVTWGSWIASVDTVGLGDRSLFSPKGTTVEDVLQFFALFSPIGNAYLRKSKRGSSYFQPGDGTEYQYYQYLEVPGRMDVSPME